MSEVNQVCNAVVVAQELVCAGGMQDGAQTFSLCCAGGAARVRADLWSQGIRDPDLSLQHLREENGLLFVACVSV